MDADLKRELSASKMRLRAKTPYFAVLGSYLKPIQVSTNSAVQTAATDAKHLFIQKPFWMSLTPLERDFVFAHEVLHAALGHCWRIGPRHPLRWNFAADFVVNLILSEAKFTMPKDCLFDEKFAKMTVEEVYSLLPEPTKIQGFLSGDVLKAPAGEAADIESSWSAAKASAAAASKMFGNTPLGEYLKVQLEASVVDWKKLLWNELSDIPSDFHEWDRRLVGDEIYVEDLAPEEIPLRAGICVDTSGSTGNVLGKFCGEVKQIAELTGYKGLDLYWADSALIGPVPLTEIEHPQGGGGTSFVPFFDKVEEKRYKKVIYLTDLEGQFPSSPPHDCDVIWLVPPGCDGDVPFGRVVKILD